MTGLMRAVYEYIEENRYKEYLPRKYYWHHQRVLEATGDALEESLTDDQLELLEKYQETYAICHIQELEAMFQAAWATARELW